MDEQLQQKKDVEMILALNSPRCFGNEVEQNVIGSLNSPRQLEQRGSISPLRPILLEVQNSQKKTPNFDFIDYDREKSPRFNETNISTKETAKELGLKYSDELTNLTMLVYPYHDLDTLVWNNKLHMFLWIFDDIIDGGVIDSVEKQNLLKKTIDILESKPLENEVNDSDEITSKWKVLVLLQQLIKGIEDDVAFREFICQQLKEYIQGVNEHVLLGDKVITTEEYIRIRRRDGACEVVWPLMFGRKGFAEYREFLESTQGIKVRHLANSNVSFVNDILSIDKDRKEGTTFNIVLIRANEYNESVEKSKQWWIVECNRMFDELKNTCVEHSIAKEVVEKLCTWCKGSALWHLKAARYNKV